jgi:diketogulonate reductase-like aldo/keto reductase
MAVRFPLSVTHTILISIAYCYANEEEVGEGLKEAFDSGVKREDIFVTTKLWCTYHSRIEEALDKSLKSLGLDYVDLFLVHWPVACNPNGNFNILFHLHTGYSSFPGNHDRFPTLPDGSRDVVRSWSHIQTWQAMEKLVDTGKVKAIGVANYSLRYLEQLLPHVKIVPAVNQIENHPSLPQKEIVDFCKTKGIHVTAFSPLGSTGSPLASVAPIVEIAKKHNVTPISVLLSYRGKP